MPAPGRTKAKSMCVVVPPHAMPRVSSSGPRVRPGSSGRVRIAWARCVCGSTPPGETIRPDASSTRAPSVGSAPGSASTAMRSPWMPTSHGPTPWGVTTVPPRTTRSSATQPTVALLLPGVNALPVSSDSTPGPRLGGPFLGSG